jgi:uncharacterized protein YbaP (TraB family)
MIRLRSLLILALFCLGLPQASIAFNPCQQDARAHYRPVRYSLPQSKALLFRIERCGTQTSYVFGTMHSDSPEVYAQAAEVVKQLPSLRVAAFEYLQPDNAAEIMQRAMIDPIGAQPLSSQLTPEEWQILKDTLGKERGMPDEALERLRPWAVSVMLQMPRLKHDGVILDDKLKAQATARKLQLKGLETMQEQMDIFAGMTQAQQVQMLKDTLSSLPLLDQMNQELETAYIKHDLYKILTLGETGFAEIEDEQLRNYLRTALLTRRNQHMAERAQDELGKGRMLIAVGALHLPGNDGLLELLEKDGYFIFPVTK